jgi:lipopolysaccharide export system ATP-binding protein
MTILNVDGLVKTYSRRRVVDGVCLDVGEGEIVGLLGPNGAGKTTTFRMICGMVRPDQGSVCLSGERVCQAFSSRQSTGNDADARFQSEAAERAV